MASKGVFLDTFPLDLGDVDLKPLRATLDRFELFDRTAPDQTAERIADAEVVVVNKVVLDGELLRGAARLRLVCLAATGTNNVDLETARELGITVCNCQAYATASVVQHTIALLLALATRVIDYHGAVRQGAWQRASAFCVLDYPIVELDGKTLGIVGYGELGRGVARLAEALGMRVLVARRPGQDDSRDWRVPLEELLPQVDALTLHCPLTPQTRGLIGERELQLMRDWAFLINTARGGIVDEQALAAALRAGKIAGAAFDVLTGEPPADGNVLLEPDIPNLIVTPHSAWGSREARQRAADQVSENVRRFLEGDPVRVVN